MSGPQAGGPGSEVDYPYFRAGLSLTIPRCEKPYLPDITAEFTMFAWDQYDYTYVGTGAYGFWGRVRIPWGTKNFVINNDLPNMLYVGGLVCGHGTDNNCSFRRIPMTMGGFAKVESCGTQASSHPASRAPRAFTVGFVVIRGPMACDSVSARRALSNLIARIRRRLDPPRRSRRGGTRRTISSTPTAPRRAGVELIDAWRLQVQQLSPRCCYGSPSPRHFSPIDLPHPTPAEARPAWPPGHLVGCNDAPRVGHPESARWR